MRTMSQQQALDRLPDDNMAKRIILHILNSPKAPIEQLKKEVDEYERERLAELSEEDQAIMTAWRR
ncbi:MAG: hypothetical protein IKP60_12550 [Treponema sp.]|nr:hypothetical protein [Treponema sp.]MBR6296932.1 hypothetical protein [Treponema sp.]